MESTLPLLCCCCCGGPHLSGNCETYTYCDLCGKDLVYCSCEPEWVLIDESYPWLGQTEMFEEPDLMVVIDESYPWLAEDWLPDPKQAEQGLIIEESWEQKRDREKQRIELEDPLVWKEAKNSQSWDGVEIQQDISQQIIFSTHLLRSKDYWSEELDQYLDSFYALFNIIHLERLWKHTDLYLKFMKLLPHKRKKKDDVFFVSYIPP